MNPELLQQIEKEVEHTLLQLIDLKKEDDYIGMSKLFAKLLATLQYHQLISPTLEVLIDPTLGLTETSILLESLQETQQRHRSRHKLLTHRQILNVWLRKNTRYKRDILPGFF
jgi:hypothetical protein